jgi:catechol 2,3-dioxygenase-like lactoylglutathione lyase family enzyme
MYHPTNENTAYRGIPLTCLGSSLIIGVFHGDRGGDMFKTSNVTILVSDMNKAIKFYTESLGLKLVSNYGGEFAVIESNGLRIGLHPGKKQTSELSRDVSLGFQVDNLASAKTALESKGIVFEKRVQDRGAVIENFRDLDGTPLYLIELKWG